MLLEVACLPATCREEPSLVQPMRTQLRRLKAIVLAAPCNRAFVQHHRARIAAERPMLSPYAVDTKVWSLLVATKEHEFLQLSVGVVRRVNRAALGPGIYDSLPSEVLNAGALIFDGHMSELHGGVTPDIAVKAINDEFSSRGIYYRVTSKPNLGLQVWPVNSAVRGRMALRKAIESYPAVAQAVAHAAPPHCSVPAPAPADPSPIVAPAVVPSGAPTEAPTGPSVAPEVLPTGDVDDEEVAEKVRLGLGRRGASRPQVVEEAVEALQEQLRHRWKGAREKLDERHAAARAEAEDAKRRVVEQRRVEDGDAALARRVRKDDEKVAIAALTLASRAAEKTFHEADVLLRRADHQVIRGDGDEQALRGGWDAKVLARDAKDLAAKNLKDAEQAHKAGLRADSRDIADTKAERDAEDVVAASALVRRLREEAAEFERAKKGSEKRLARRVEDAYDSIAESRPAAPGRDARQHAAEVKKAGVMAFAGPNHRANAAFVTASVSVDAFGLKFAADALRQDRDVVLAAVGRDALAVKFASPQLQDDDHVLWAAVAQRAEAEGIDFADAQRAEAQRRLEMPARRASLAGASADSAQVEDGAPVQVAPDQAMIPIGAEQPATDPALMSDPASSTTPCRVDALGLPICNMCGAASCAFAVPWPALRGTRVVDEVPAAQVEALQQQVAALQRMSEAQVDMHLADAVGKFRSHSKRPVKLLLAERHTGPVQVALAQRALRWGCVVHTDLGRGQEHGDSCGYNAAVDIERFLAHRGRGPWWQPEATAWQPHQASLAEISAANEFLAAGGGGPARLLTSMEVVRLVARAFEDPVALDGFGGALPWDLSLVAFHDAVLESIRAMSPHEGFHWGAVLNTVRSGGRGSHWFPMAVFCPPAMPLATPPAEGSGAADAPDDDADPPTPGASGNDARALPGRPERGEKRKQPAEPPDSLIRPLLALPAEAKAIRSCHMPGATSGRGMLPENFEDLDLGTFVEAAWERAGAVPGSRGSLATSSVLRTSPPAKKPRTWRAPGLLTAHPVPSDLDASSREHAPLQKAEPIGSAQERQQSRAPKPSAPAKASRARKLCIAHGKREDNCFDCKPALLCKHGVRVRKMNCQECNPQLRCEHNVRKVNCQECNPSRESSKKRSGKDRRRVIEVMTTESADTAGEVTVRAVDSAVLGEQPVDMEHGVVVTVQPPSRDKERHAQLQRKAILDKLVAHRRKELQKGFDAKSAYDSLTAGERVVIGSVSNFLKSVASYDLIRVEPAPNPKRPPPPDKRLLHLVAGV